MPTRLPSPRVHARRRAQRLAAAPALLATALTLAACGGAGGDENADPAKIAPQGSIMYFTGAIRPDGDQREAVDALSQKVFKIADPGQRIQRKLDEGFKQDPTTRDVTYADDIAPWLGRRAGAAVTRLGAGDQAQFAVIIASQDSGAAQEAIEREAGNKTPKWVARTYKDVEYFYDPGDRTGQGAVGDYVVVASEPAFKATVDASESQGLSEKPDFKSAAAASEDKLGFGYVDVKALLAAASASGQLPPGSGAQLQSLLGSGAKPAILSLDAQPDRVTLETVARGVKAPAATETPLVQALPADSWLAFGAPKVGEQLRRTTSQLSGGVGEGVLSVVRQQLRAQTGLDLDRDVLPAFGDVALFARGSNLLTIGGGLVVQTPDPAAAGRVVSKLGPLVSRQGGAMGLRVANTTVGGARGFKISSSQLPGSINVVAGRDRMVIAYGDSATSAALAPQGRLADTPAYKTAQESVGGQAPQLFVQFAPIAQLMGVSADPDVTKARSYLSALNTLAAGSKVEGDTQTGRMVITVR